MRKLSAVLVAVMLVGCGETPYELDAGSPGGGSGGAAGGGSGGGSTGGGTGGGSTGGGSGGGATGGGSGGGATGGGTGGGATGGGTGGGSTGGGTGGGSVVLTDGGMPAPFSYGMVSITSTSANNAFSIRGISGRSGEVYAVSENGHLLRSTGAGFSQVARPANQGNAIWVAPDGAVFISAMRQLSHCLTNCATGTSYTTTAIAATEDIFAVCGTSSSNVYAVGHRDNEEIGVLYQWNGTTWTRVSNDLGLKGPSGCTILPNGTLFITGRRDVVRWQAAAAFNETASLDLSAIPTSQFQYWRAMWIDSTGFGLVVGDYHRVLKREPNGTWSFFVDPNPATNAVHRTLVGTGPTEIYGAGSIIGATGSKNLHRYDGASWKPAASELPGAPVIHSAFLASPNEVYFAGGSSGGPAVILRGVR